MKVFRAEALFGKQLGKDGQHIALGSHRYASEVFNEATLIDSADLVEDNMRVFSFKSGCDAARIGSGFGSHWGDNDSLDIVIHFIG
jgi:hypothetical protein